MAWRLLFFPVVNNDIRCVDEHHMKFLIARICQ